MHTTALRSDAFQITVAGRAATLADVFPGFAAEDRLGIVLTADRGAAGAASLILAAITAFYDHLRARDPQFFAYADYFAFHVGGDRGTLRKLDVYPAHKEVVVGVDAEAILEAVNDRGVTRLLVPEGPPATPELARETRHSAHRRIRTALVYSPTGQTARADVFVRGSAQSDVHIRAMLGRPATASADVQAAQGFRRVSLDEALGLLPTTRG
ncbi:MAG TPA: hypothetical protein VGH67_00010 [Solirubrobacteraceae bacterium]